MLLVRVLSLVNNIASKSSVKGTASHTPYGKIPRCGKPLRALSTTHSWETMNDTQGNDLGYSKNERDWAIRRLTT